MDDDLNTSVALAAIHNLTREVNTALARKQLREDNKQELLDLLKRCDTVLNIFGDDQREILDSEVQALIDERQEARRRRDFARADEIRDELADAASFSKTPKTACAGNGNELTLIINNHPPRGAPLPPPGAAAGGGRAKGPKEG